MVERHSKTDSHFPVYSFRSEVEKRKNGVTHRRIRLFKVVTMTSRFSCTNGLLVISEEWTKIEDMDMVESQGCLMTCRRLLEVLHYKLNGFW